MAVPLPKLTPEQYLAMEREAEYKSEYYNGEMFAMAGGIGPHNQLCGRIIGVLFRGLDRSSDCTIYTSDMRVRTGEDGLYTYPDVTVTCGKPVFSDRRRDVLVNPKVIFEVLSKSTEAKDRSFKFHQYKMIASLDEYVLVSQTEPFVERWGRGPNSAWTDHSEARGFDATLELKSLGIELPLAEIYRDVEFERD